jgi:hypothetical protein
MDGGELENLGEWQLADYKGELLAELGKEVHQAAQFHCDELRRQAKYRAIAYNEAGEQCHQFTMSQLPEPMEGEAPPASMDLDEPSAAGLAAQAMRHQERQFSLIMPAYERIIRSLQEQLVHKDEVIAKMQKRDEKLSELAREMYERGPDQEAQEQRAQRIDRTLEVLIEKVLPAGLMEVGLLPSGFTVDGDTSKLETTPEKLAAEIAAKQGAAEGGNGKAKAGDAG